MTFWRKIFGGSEPEKASRPASPPAHAQTKGSTKVNGASFLDDVEKGDVERVKAVLKSFPGLISVKESSGWGETALHKAVGKGNTEMVKLLLASNADVNAQDANHQSPLYDAVSRDHEEIVKLLLARKAAVNSLNCQGDFTPLHNAKSRRMAELLIAHGANVHATTDKEAGRATPLHTAAQDGRREVVETLIAHGAKVDARKEWGSTPLHCAVMENKKDVVQVLLASKADATPKDQWGRTVFDLAQEKPELLEMLRMHAGR